MDLELLIPYWLEMPVPFWLKLAFAELLTPGMPAEAVAALRSIVESFTSASADCLPVGLLVASPFCLSCL